MAANGNGDSPYRAARIATGSGCFLLAGILYLLDFASVDFQVDTIQLGLILGTGTLLLGVEAGKALLGVKA